jgi:tetratricopeptide (TPR) repeat protein
MLRKLQISALTLAVLVSLAATAAAQSGQIKGKVTDADGKPVQGAQIVIEFAEGVNRKFEVKSDRRGEFIQIGLQPGNYRVTATVDKLGSFTQQTRVTLSRPAELLFEFKPGAGVDPEASAKAVALKKAFEEGVAATQAKNFDLAIQKFEEAAAVLPSCYDCYYNIGYAYSQKKDDKGAETAWLKAVELKADYTEALNALATLYNNQKRFDEAAAVSAKAAAAGGVIGGSGNADAVYNQGIILWNQGKIAEAKEKFAEALKVNAEHPEANYQMGMALLNEGNMAGAVTSFEKYLQVAPNGQFAAQAKAMLAQLKK